MAQQKNPALDKYEFTGKFKAGICGTTGIQYSVNTISEKMIEVMIEKGTDIFKKKTAVAKAKAEPKEEK